MLRADSLDETRQQLEKEKLVRNSCQAFEVESRF